MPLSWIIMGLVAAILISSLAKLLPRGRTLHINRLREAARKLGYRVERQPELANDPALARCIGYRQSLQRCPLSREFSCQREGEGWRWIYGSSEAAGVDAVLEALPAGVVRLERQAHSVLVLWPEPDRLDDLTALDEALAPMREPVA